MSSPWAVRTARVFGLGLSLLLLTAAPAAACSCPGLPIEWFLDRPNKYPHLAVFTGVVQPDEGKATPVKVDRWFHGKVRPSVVDLENDWVREGHEEGACWAERPTTGVQYIFVVFEPTDGLVGVGYCTPHGSVDGREGKELLAEARKLFGDGMPDTDTIALPGGAADALPDGWLLVICSAALGAALFVTRRIAQRRART